MSLACASGPRHLNQICNKPFVRLSHGLLHTTLYLNPCGPTEKPRSDHNCCLTRTSVLALVQGLGSPSAPLATMRSETTSCPCFPAFRVQQIFSDVAPNRVEHTPGLIPLTTSRYTECFGTSLISGPCHLRSTGTSHRPINRRHAAGVDANKAKIRSAQMGR